MQDLPDRSTAEDEGDCGGKRKGGGGGEKRGAAVRGSEVLCLRHGGRLREAGEDTQHGPVLSQETLVHPSQALELSQSRESLQRGGGESCREGPADGACRQGGREGGKERREAVCTERLTQEISASAVKYLKQGSRLRNSGHF